VQSASLQQSSRPGWLHVVAETTGNWQTRYPPGMSSTHCPSGGQSAAVEHSPPGPVPPVPVEVDAELVEEEDELVDPTVVAPVVVPAVPPAPPVPTT
jgi:hypothetical protein